MNDDFVTRLGRQLREAAEREQRRSPLARAGLVARASAPDAPRPLLAFVATVAVLALLAYVATTFLPSARVGAGPGIVDRFLTGRTLGDARAAFDGVWVDDTGDQRLLRIDPRSRRIVARIPARGGVSIAIGERAVWVLEATGAGYQLNGPLLRIDPTTDRVVARIPLRTRSGTRFPASAMDAMVVLPHALWVAGPSGALRIDPATNRVTAAIATNAGGYEVVGAGGGDGDLWISLADGRLLRLDGRTGARKAQFHPAVSGAISTIVTVGRALVVIGCNEVARLDPTTGRVLWLWHVASTGCLRPPAAARGGLWFVVPAVRGGDRLIALDPATGRRRAGVALGELGSTGPVVVGRNLWVPATDGHIVIVRP